VFLRLKFPRDYHLNFKEIAFNPPRDPPSGLRPNFSSRSSSNASFSSNRVLCWIPKVRAFNATPNQVPSAPRVPLRQASNSNSSLGPRVHHNVQGPAQVPMISILNCSKCLDFGHSRKDCTNLVRCQSCFKYGHKSSACLSKAQNQRRYRPISVVEVGG